MTLFRRRVLTALVASFLVSVLTSFLPVQSQSPAQAPAATPEPIVGESAEESRATADLGPANQLVRDGDLVGADHALATLQEEFPEDPRVFLLRGELLLSLQKPEEALPLLQRSVELDPQRPRTHFQVATALQMTGDRDAALTAYAREIEITDDRQVIVMARLNRSLLLGQAEEFHQAAIELEAVVALEPERAEAFGDMASLYLRAGKLEEAARSLERGLDHGYRSARHHYALGNRFYEKEIYAAAIEALGQALNIDPTLAEAEQTLANALDRQGKDQEALQHLRRYLELKPNAPDAQKVADWIRSIEAR